MSKSIAEKRSERPARKGGLGALRGLARSMSHSFEMARERALAGQEEPRVWSGEERRRGRRRELDPAVSRARVMLSDAERADRRSVEDRRNDSNLIRLGAGALREAPSRPARAPWA